MEEPQKEPASGEKAVEKIVETEVTSHSCSLSHRRKYAFFSSDPSSHALLSVSLLVSILANIVLVLLLLIPQAHHLQRTAQLPQNFSLLYPPFSDLSREEFLEIREEYTINYLPLKESILASVEVSSSQEYAFYFSDLNSGASIGYNEKETFYSGSLRKVPLLVAALKKIEEEELTWETPITILPEDLNPYSGPLYRKGAGYALTMRELLNYTTFYSDNTAAAALLRIVGNKDVVDVMFNMGLSYQTFVGNKGNVDRYPLSAKEFSRTFRNLYYSSILLRRNSQFILESLAHTNFMEGIPAGIPADVVVSHKTAYFLEGSHYHDCGIVYYPRNPYILCVMTSGMSEQEANQLMSMISEMVYAYVISH